MTISCAGASRTQITAGPLLVVSVPGRLADWLTPTLLTIAPVASHRLWAKGTEGVVCRGLVDQNEMYQRTWSFFFLSFLRSPKSKNPNHIFLGIANVLKLYITTLSI